MPVPESEYLSPVWKDGIFNDRVAFVTGGAGSICSAQTRALVRLGANACIIGRNVEKTEAMAKDLATARPGAKVIGIGGCDVRNPQSLQDAADRCARELGSIDFVIAGAAGNFVAPLSGMSPNAFKAVIDIDVLGTFNTIKATMPYLVESAKKNPTPSKDGRTGGRIIFVSATFHWTGMPLQAHVSAAKAAVDALMASVTLEYGPFGVTSNVIAPGPIKDTEGMQRLASSQQDQSKADALVPQGRWGIVRDIADSTVYLFSDAGNFVNGQAIPVDGGAWRRGGALAVGTDETMQYPDFLLKGEFSKHVKSGRKKDSKL
ncbi:sporulation protein SPS19 [Colletotrichum tofieldiae]|uniref:2,4-dienoyl-CoA reductase [(3E)-enoyl-CoA-producing] n=1 Tax=Colletotrichum tofieldiae TaxID=708197 RepID=A0A166Q982_9PEZI|nr:sporulation protein SPS19 (short-chain dehydrogenase) [Colletotrichum tofieldiae]GKT63607.1 sporulation protein SPS19 [Colletotrichum tofieldiae]GKT72384.1 sporulation protein SPS19 [Colletotrichum tofieldiae]